MQHIIDLVGDEHVSVGSDYDGIARGPEDLEDASCYGTLAELLLRKGLTEVDVEKIAWAVFDRAGESVNSLGQRPLEERDYRNASP